ncbi:hypothetical protein GPECTOR_36g108 [Gonium pectorale]|uniref:Uncharacterized protein n=1 Tax=Gonium pectorale TaxID=33097 RepID=A0A150GBN9_GONPE|nr:hypothetical protein GPECTOR_36g108 [Gonium pectorale]|eukprot:KXZ47254.1 hypothetical protein GPECTOR_36g108 [Gonium pectorale]
MSKPRQTGSGGGFGRAFYTDDDIMYDDDAEYIPPARKKTPAFGGKERPSAKRPTPAHSPPPGAGVQPTSPGKAVRSRPTNNQLLYKAYFRWAHYPHKLKNANLPVETDACASVTAAFLQVLQIMQTAEQLRHGNNKRNVLQILSSNTRRTKVVELSSGTHRVPDELKKHYLSDGEGGQYSTNLDRNRYGNDDNYLFTVIRYDLEFLGLCPCMVDVEIIDAKQGNSSIIVSAGTEVCTCQGGPPLGAMPQMPAAVPPAPYHHHPAAPPPPHGMEMHRPAISGERRVPPGIKAEYPPAGPMHEQLAGAGPTNSGYGGGRGEPPDLGPVPQLYGGGGGGGGASLRGGAGLGGPVGRESPKRSGTSVSQLFDALVMAATGGADGAAAAGGLGGEPPVTSPAHADRPDRVGPVPGMGFGGGSGGGGGIGGPRMHGPPNRNKSKLWSINNLSFGGEVDSLQNALDAFREQDEIASGDPAAFLTGGSAGGAAVGPDGSLQRSDSLRHRRRKPMRNSSILGRPTSSGGVAPMGPKLAMNLREKSDDNLRLAADPEVGTAAGMGTGGGAFGPGGLPGAGRDHLHGGGGGGATQVSSLVSGEDDNDGGAGEADAEDALAAKEDLGVEGEGEAGGEEDGLDDGGRGGLGLGSTASGTFARGAGMAGRHGRGRGARRGQVAAAVGGGRGAWEGSPLLGPGGLGGSAAAAVAGEQLRRLANELEVVRHENRSLRQQLQRASSSTLNGTSATGSPGLAGKPPLPAPLPLQETTEAARLRKLEAELSSMRGELMGLNSAKKSADEENRQLKRELLASQQQVAALLSRMLGSAAPTGIAPAPGAAAGGTSGAAQPPLQQQQSAMPPAAGAAFDPSAFAAHFAAMRQGPPHQAGTAVDAPARTNEARLTAADGIPAARIIDGAAAEAHRRSEPGAAHGDAADDAAYHHQALGRKRTAEEAGLPSAQAAAHAAGPDAPPHKASPPSPGARDRGQASAAQRQLMSFPTFAPYIPPASGLQQQQSQPQPQHPQTQVQAPAPQPADSAATPADSVGFSDVVQLLALPNLDSGFVATSELAVPAFGSGSGAAAAAPLAAVTGALAASSGPMAGTGSGSGSGTASGPQMPQFEQHMMLTGMYGGQPQSHVGLR